MAAAIRGGVALDAILAAGVGAVPPVSLIRLVPVLVVFAAWSAVYVARVWTRGLTGLVISVDLALACWLCLDLGALVPPAAQPRGTSWVVTAASMIVVCAQLNGRPSVSIPGGLLVAVCFVVGSRVAGVADGGTPQAVVLAAQAVSAAGCMLVATRTGRAASLALAGLQAAERAATIRRAQHEDELAQLRIVHNGALTTLTMAAHSASSPSALLSQRASTDLAGLPRLAEFARTPDAEAEAVPLHDRLAQVVARYRSLLEIHADLAPCVVPRRVAQAFSEAASEALENVTRHAGTTGAEVTSSTVAGRVTVRIADHGRGFDPVRTDAGFGLREAIVGRMRGIGGRAVVRSSPGAGATVVLEWDRD